MGSKCSKCTGKSNLSSSLHSQMPEQAGIIENSVRESIIQLSLDDSLLTMEKIISNCQNNPEILLKFACHLYEKELATQAAEIFDKVVGDGFSLDVKSAVVYCKMQIQQKNFDYAKKLLETYLEIFPESDQLYFLYGEMHGLENNNSLSQKYIKKALKLNSQNPEYHNIYGLCLMKSKKYEKALKHFFKAYKFDETMAKALNNAGNAYRKLGNSIEAIKCYNTAINLIPKRKFPIALINLATTCFYTGDMISTLIYFEEALQTGSNIHKIMVKKGYHLLFKNPKTKLAIETLHSQDFIKAVALFAEILKTDRTNPVVSYYMASALLKQGKLQEAYEYLKAVVEFGQKSIFLNMQFVKHYVKRASKLLDKQITKQPCEEIPEVDEDSENSTINIGALEVFKVRAESLVVPYQPRNQVSPTDSPVDTSVEEEVVERCVVI